MQPWKFFLRKVPGLPGRGMPPKLSFQGKKSTRDLLTLDTDTGPT